MLAAGEVINGYRIVRPLGRGGFGITYEAEGPKGRVALKQLILRGSGSWKGLELFQREARTLEGLRHPAIPRYLEDFEVDGPGGPTYYLVQEIAAGRTLAAKLEAGWRPTEEEVRRLAEEILGVLSYLGRLQPPVVHRDLKPDNLLVSDDGAVSLVDFGSVKDALRDGSTVAGTFGYMAPEQFRGQSEPASDLYGLGMTLLHVLTQLEPEDMPVSRLRVSVARMTRVSDGFAAWLQKMVEPALEDRFVTAEEARAALREPEPKSAPKPAPAKPKRARPRISESNDWPGTVRLAPVIVAFPCFLMWMGMIGLRGHALDYAQGAGGLTLFLAVAGAAGVVAAALVFRAMAWRDRFISTTLAAFVAAGIFAGSVAFTGLHAVNRAWHDSPERRVEALVVGKIQMKSGWHSLVRLDDDPQVFQLAIGREEYDRLIVPVRTGRLGWRWTDVYDVRDAPDLR